MKPEQVIRFGTISASIFLNQIETDSGRRTLRDVKLQRRYRATDGEWKSSAYFTLAELPVAIAVLQRAMVYVADKEADTTNGNKS